MIIGNLDRLDADTCAGWALDSADPASVLSVRFVVNGRQRYEDLADLERTDVGKVHGSSRHGFSFGVTRYLDQGENGIEVRVGNRTESKILDSRVVDIPPDELERRRRDADLGLVEIGRDGWLFLQNDSNKFRDVLTGKLPLRADQVSTTVSTLRRRTAMLDAQNARSVTYVVPEKGIVCNNLRKDPLKISDNRPAMQIRGAIGLGNTAVYAYFIDHFTNHPARESLFRRNDTHASGKGFELIFGHLMELVDTKNVVRWSGPELVELRGDLGDKLSPPQRETLVRRKAVYKTEVLRDEIAKVVEHGGRYRGKRLYHRSGAPNDFTCVLVGTSTAYHMREMFFSQFRHVHFYWSNTVDYTFMQAVRPNYVFAIVNERFLGTGIEDSDGQIHPLRTEV